MALVRFNYTLPNEAGDLVAAQGQLQFKPTRRRIHDTTVVLPIAFSVELDEHGAATVDLAPTSTQWVWRIYEDIKLLLPRPRKIFVIVPDVAEIAATDLQEVDPATLDPSPAALAGWEAVINEAQQLRTETVDAANLAAAIEDDVLTAAEQVRTDTKTATTAATESQNARTDAVAAKNTATTASAATSRDAAATEQYRTEAKASAAAARAAGYSATASPDYPDTLRIFYPAALSPRPHVVRLPIGGTL